MVLIIVVLIIIVITLASLLYTQHIQQVQEKAAFLSLASHEMRSPLTGIRWSLETIMADSASALDPLTRKTLAAIYDNCLMLIMRVNNMLNMAAVERGIVLHKEPVAMRLFLQEIIKGIALGGKERGVSTVIDPSISDALIAVVDKQYMRQVFSNLVAYAVRSSDPNTEVRISYTQKRSNHLFSVTDHGKGLSEEERVRVFEGYSYTDRTRASSHESSGLGLHLALRLVQLHGGTMDISPSSPERSVCSISVPT